MDLDGDDFYDISAGLPLPPALRKSIDADVGALAAEVDERRKRVIDAMASAEERERARILREEHAALKRTLLDSWFEEARALSKMRKEVLAIEDKAARKQPIGRALRGAEARVAQALEEFDDPGWRREVMALSQRLQALDPARQGG